uniref:Uncharacterized protein n=1 Tax=Oryza punctata TaxID=4537 RepID=A0A0E0M9C4_ORYPU
MKKGKWSKEEDDLIKNHMEKYGIGRSWQALSDALGLRRCGRSCRSRWLNYLRPGLKHGDFSPSEERIICKMYSKRGSSWSAIAAQLPGRTDLAVKNYWNSTLKKRFPATAAAATTARSPAASASATTSSDDDDDVDDAIPPGLALVVSSEGGSTTTNAAAGELTPYSVSSPTAIADAAEEEEEPIAAVPISTCILALPPPPPPPPPKPSDATGGEVSIPCFPFSPLPFIEPDLPELTWTTDLDDIAAGFTAAAAAAADDDDDACRYPKRPLPITPDSPRLPKLPSITGFDDVQSFLSWFDD